MKTRNYKTRALAYKENDSPAILEKLQYFYELHDY